MGERKIKIKECAFIYNRHISNFTRDIERRKKRTGLRREGGEEI